MPRSQPGRQAQRSSRSVGRARGAPGCYTAQMADLILAHDLGTTGDKATLFDARGRLIGSASASYPTQYPHPGWAEQDARDYWDAFCASTRELLATSGRQASQIAAVSFSGHMQAALRA